MCPNLLMWAIATLLHDVIYSLPLFCRPLSCHSNAPHGTSLYPHVHVCSVLKAVWDLVFPLSPFIPTSSHFISPLSPLWPSVHPPTPVWPLLPLSLGSGCGEVSLSLMTARLLPARPPLCPQLVQLSRETDSLGSGEVSQADQLCQNNKPQQNIFQQILLHSWGQASEVQ